MVNRTFIILGPDAGDVPSHWDREFWQWVEGAAGDVPGPSCVYTAEELRFPLAEYPSGGVGVACLETGQILTLPRGGGLENKI